MESYQIVVKLILPQSVSEIAVFYFWRRTLSATRSIDSAVETADSQEVLQYWDTASADSDESAEKPDIKLTVDEEISHIISKKDKKKK